MGCSIGVAMGGGRVRQPDAILQRSVPARYSIQPTCYSVLPEEHVSVLAQASQLLYY
jgi:hypothetical protein